MLGLLPCGKAEKHLVELVAGEKVRDFLQTSQYRGDVAISHCVGDGDIDGILVAEGGNAGLGRLDELMAGVKDCGVDY